MLRTVIPMGVGVVFFAILGAPCCVTMRRYLSCAPIRKRPMIMSTQEAEAGKNFQALGFKNATHPPST